MHYVVRFTDTDNFALVVIKIEEHALTIVLTKPKLLIPSRCPILLSLTLFSPCTNTYKINIIKRHATREVNKYMFLVYIQ